MVRNTKQREKIIKILKQKNRPLSIKEILYIANECTFNLSIATIYRALNYFLISGKVYKIQLPGCVHRYQIKNDNHYHHFWCRICDSVFKVEGCPGELNFQPPKGFKSEAHEVTFKGLCVNCIS